MAKKQKAPVVVAELGRPETPSETSARKSRDSQLYRQRKTVNNLVFSLLVTLAMAIILVLIVPRGTDTWKDHAVDVASVAAETSPSVGMQLAAPEVPEGWLAKQAEVRRAQSGDISYWYIGYNTPENGYAAVVQAYTASGAPVDATWVAQQLEGQLPTGDQAIGGADWVVYDHQDRNPDEANMLFGLRTELDSLADGPAATLLVYGTASADTIRDLAEAAFTSVKGAS